MSKKLQKFVIEYSPGDSLTIPIDLMLGGTNCQYDARLVDLISYGGLKVEGIGGSVKATFDSKERFMEILQEYKRDMMISELAVEE